MKLSQDQIDLLSSDLFTKSVDVDSLYTQRGILIDRLCIEINKNPFFITSIPTPVLKWLPIFFDLIDKRSPQHLDTSFLSDQEMVSAINLCPSLIKFVKDPSEALMKYCVENNDFSISLVFPSFANQASVEVQKIAISKNPSCLLAINNPKESVILLALSKLGTLLKNVKNPTEEMEVVALQNTGYALEFIQNQTPEKVDLALMSDPFCLEFVKDQNETLVWKAISKDPHAILYSKNPTDSQLKYCIINETNRSRSRKTLIGIVKKFKLNRKLLKLAIKKDFEVLNHIAQDLDICFYALSQDKNSFNYINIVKSPDPETCLYNLKMKQKIFNLVKH